MTLSLRLPSTLVADLDAYAEYVGGESDRRYVAQQILTAFLVRDREFRVWFDARAASESSSGAKPPDIPRK